MTSSSDSDYTSSGLTEVELDAQLEQEGAELERQLVAYVKKLEQHYNVKRCTTALHIGVNTWFEIVKPLRIQWISAGNSLSGDSIHDVAAVCLTAPADTLKFRGAPHTLCPTLINGKVEWR